MIKKDLYLDGRSININTKPYLIAEIGLNHNKDIELTKKMIKKAKESGADAVKFQVYETENLINEESDAFNIFKNLELTYEEIKTLKEYSDEIGITFFATPFSFKSVDLLEKLNVPFYKIASMDINYYEFIKYIAEKEKPIILSTGMSSLGEIEKAVNTIIKTGNENIAILHCISKYPPEYGDMNIRMITKLATLFSDYQIGFSDHTLDNSMAIVARTLGATIFEKHFTLDKNLEGPDHKISSTPEEFAHYRETLLNVDKSLNYISKERGDIFISQFARRSLFANCDIPKGTKITKEMIKIVRPGDGIAPEYLPLFIGKEVKKDIKKNQKIDISMI
ncbi:MAG TPA: N-acetylneuraminate synthase family protein [Spirochaetota bacterium]|nr:N-acetylneuraminate synthase family protein [Spirochaetota bacterium]HOL58218.1 N-acetylneuraminate synthase family protein [Spirochaetota bacterium]HPP05700.1 N-acetylneuraminate synthase family protein [Spirochaetota bacterium]